MGKNKNHKNKKLPDNNWSLEVSPQQAWQNSVSAFENGQPAQALKFIMPLLSHPSADGNTYLLAGIVQSSSFQTQLVEQDHYNDPERWKDAMI